MRWTQIVGAHVVTWQSTSWWMKLEKLGNPRSWKENPPKREVWKRQMKWKPFFALNDIEWYWNLDPLFWCIESQRHTPWFWLSFLFVLSTHLLSIRKKHRETFVGQKNCLPKNWLALSREWGNESPIYQCKGWFPHSLRVGPARKLVEVTLSPMADALARVTASPACQVSVVMMPAMFVQTPQLAQLLTMLWWVNWLQLGNVWQTSLIFGCPVALYFNFNVFQEHLIQWEVPFFGCQIQPTHAPFQVPAMIWVIFYVALKGLGIRVCCMIGQHLVCYWWSSYLSSCCWVEVDRIFGTIFCFCFFSRHSVYTMGFI